MEHWDRMREDGLFFCWEDGVFPPGTDSFLLSAFPRLRPRQRVCDLGCGTGLLGLLALQREPSLCVTGVELSPRAAALAEQAAARNGLPPERFSVLQGDLRTVHLPAGAFDLVISNPPYFPTGSGALPAEKLRQARTEEGCSLHELCAAAARLLRWGGSFCLVQKPERLTDLLCALRASGLEPKRLRLVSSRAGQAPSLLLVEGRRGGKSGLTIEPPLLLQSPDGSPSMELDAIYFRTKEPML